MQRALEDKDLADVLEKDKSVYNRDYFLNMWKAEKQAHPDSPSLHRAILKDFFKTTWFVQPMMMIAQSARVVQAVVLGFLIQSFEGANDRGYLWAGILVLCGLIVLFEHHHVFFLTWRRGMQIRISCVAAIHDKSIRLSSTHQETSASYGRIMNMASNDVERFLMAALFISHLFWGPVISIAILIVGSIMLGPAFAAGLALLILVFVPLQFYLSGKFAYYRSRVAAITDRRVTFVSQAVRGARVMKMSGYEWRFLDRIAQFRNSEVQQIAKANTLKSWNEALFFSTNVVISLVVFLVHVGTGHDLNPGEVFTVFTLINILQLEMTKHVSLGVMGVSEAYVSVKRIQNFLEFPELPSRSPGRSSESSDGVALSLSHVKAYWNEVTSNDSKQLEDSTDHSNSSVYLALDDVSIDFHSGELTAIIGSVGSGKSALLQAIVQELPISSGNAARQYHALSYGAQDAWVMDGTARENIVMGLKFDKDWYNTVVKACGLVLDFQQLRDGDMTVLGDRGVQCSGGQRARIGLARAIYRDADILVADDPLSAVDAKVGRQIFQEAILGLGVKRGKCVVLTTHQHQYVNDCRCVLVSRGRLACIGSYEECVKASDGKLKAHEADSSVDNLVDGVEDSTALTEDSVREGDNPEKEFVADSDNKEITLQGIVQFSTYMNYLRAMGGVWVGVSLLFLFSITQGAVLVAIAFIGRWAERPPSEQDNWDIMGTVIGLACTVIVLAIIRAFLSFQILVRASQRLHDRMAMAVLRARIEFFDTNPLGRIMNRFSADVGVNDDMLPSTIFDFCMIAFMVVGALITTVAALPFTLIALPPLMWYFISVRRIFVTSTRELKRLEGLARSPIFAIMSESLGGIASIRANDGVAYFQRKFQDAHDAHTRAFFAFIASSRWVGFRMDSIVFLFLAVASFLAVLFQQQGWFAVDPTILGLSISMLLQLAGLFQWCIRQSAEVVNYMVCVERVLQFGELEPEAPLEYATDSALLSSGWPQKGSMDVKDLSVRYRASLPFALDGVSLSIPRGSRVGIVGRTGSGKSTVVQSLFRLLEAERGQILVDGVDIKSLGLHTLRTHMSVLPQVPTLFSGCSVRENLDLFGLHSDEELRTVLRDCHLMEVVEDLPNGMESLVAESGSNFSVGQRQLLCLARAILSRNRILVLDEATASVDRRTDELIQATLQKTFHDGTILAVAHRLDTVIENDFILVLGNGRVLEFGAPADLLRRSGPLASMVADTGDSMARELRRRALLKEKKAA